MLFKNKYRIESSRLNGYDYSSEGAYYITTVSKNRKCYFGEIENEEMYLNEFGKIVDDYWNEIPDHFLYATLDEYIVMPNHVHGIIFLNEFKDEHSKRESTKRQPIGVIINLFKGVCTSTLREIDKHFGWQSRYHDHIIRNEDELNRIRRYIRDNPSNWDSDKLNF